LSPQSGTEFADAAELWRKLQEEAGEQPQTAPQKIKKGAE
jgi:hypothetical protein